MIAIKNLKADMKKATHLLKLLCELIVMMGFVFILSLVTRTSIGYHMYSPSGLRAQPYPPPTSSFFFSATSTHQPTQSPVHDKDGNGWYIYQDVKADFSFSYLPDKVANVSGGPKSVNIAFRLLKIGGHQGMAIQIYPNPQRLALNEITRKFYEETALKPAPINFPEMIKPQQSALIGKTVLKVVIPSVVSDF
jgi:hypothetical protein